MDPVVSFTTGHSLLSAINTERTTTLKSLDDDHTMLSSESGLLRVSLQVAVLRVICEPSRNNRGDSFILMWLGGLWSYRGKTRMYLDISLQAVLQTSL